MREILFRGKRIDNGEWVFGDLIREPWGYCIQVVTGSGNEYIRKKYAITEETVGQYTGLNDKHGKRVFEGDIISFFNWGGNVLKRAVVWDPQLGRFSVFIDGALSVGVNPISGPHKVIGNIHDNPELMKDEK